MGVLPEWRGRGVGRRLIERTLEAARAFPLTRVELSVRADNAAPLPSIARSGSRWKAAGSARCLSMAYTMTIS